MQTYATSRPSTATAGWVAWSPRSGGAPGAKQVSLTTDRDLYETRTSTLLSKKEPPQVRGGDNTSERGGSLIMSL